MSTERTDQYPEVSGDEAGIVPPQGAKAEWPKKIRTLTASELDRLTIDGLGRFYWDGKLVNYYESTSGRIEPPKPVDLDQHAMDLLDRTARELSDPHSVHAEATTEATTTVEATPAELPDENAPPSAPELAATQSDQIAPTAAAAVAAVASAAPAAPSPVVEVRRQEILSPAIARADVVRVKLSAGQSIALFLVVVGLMAAALGTALSGLATAHEWGCKTGLLQSYCPAPPPEPKAPPRPDIPA